MSMVTIIFLVSLLFKRDENNTSSEEDMKRILPDRATDILCRFVYDETGKELGESIAVYEDILIIKKGKKYIGVPFKHITEEDNIIKVKGLIDTTKAEMIGEEWQKRSFKELKIKNNGTKDDDKKEDERNKEFTI
ncbi:MAG: DUF5749 family beta-barrel protein [Candidatus Thermoplasmatota archaeon]